MRTIFGVLTGFVLCASQVSITPVMPRHLHRANNSFLHPLFDREAGKAGIHLAIAVPELDSTVALYFNIFKLSRVAVPAAVDLWIYEGGIPRDYRFPLSLIFQQYFQGRPPLDENGDACMGYFHKAEVCLEVSHCLLISSFLQEDIFVPLHWAGEYVVEAFVSSSIHGTCAPPTPVLPLYSQSNVPRLEDRGPLLIPQATFSPKTLNFVIEYSDEVSAWWGLQHGLQGTDSWMEFMSLAVKNALPLVHNGGQVLEFGVAQGKSLSFLAHVLPTVTVTGFDSFRGLPMEWGRYPANLFNMFGTPPLVLLKFANIDLKIGYFNATLPLVDRTKGIGLLHIDSDLYESAAEVLGSLGCLLGPGSVVVFDEWFNMKGTYGGDAKPWYRDGEFLAFLEAAEELEIAWEPLGFYFEQAFALRILKMDKKAHLCLLQDMEVEETREAAEERESAEFISSMRQLANGVSRDLATVPRVQELVNKIEASGHRAEVLRTVRELVALAASLTEDS